MPKRSHAGAFFLVCCCWITVQYTLVINSRKNIHSKNDDMVITLSQTVKILEGEKRFDKGNATLIPKSIAYKGARTASGEHGYVASTSTLNLCG